MSDSLSLDSGRRHFFVSRSFKAALSSIASAKSFFSLPFSLSSPLKRLASESSSPRTWPAPGSEDTELGVLMELEVGHGETEVYARVQA